jgi:hypothetical protein
MNQIFAAAAAGTDQVASLWAHLAESDFLPSLVQIDGLAQLETAQDSNSIEGTQTWIEMR